MNYQGRFGRKATQVARSQLAVRLGIAVYALLCASITLRCAVLVFAFPETVATVTSILSASSLLVAPLAYAPAADRSVIGSATLSDLTAALVLLAVPLALLGRRSRV
jgi:hypothetical protein